MRLLLDTHAFLWWLLDSPHLTRAARSALEDGANDVFVSAATGWEITTKHRLGKLPDAADVAADLEGEIRRQAFVPLSITMAQAELAGRLEGSHRDPFDRMLIAQALLENLVLISNETAFDTFGVSRVW